MCKSRETLNDSYIFLQTERILLNKSIVFKIFLYFMNATTTPSVLNLLFPQNFNQNNVNVFNKPSTKQTSPLLAMFPELRKPRRALFTIHDKSSGSM